MLLIIGGLFFFSLRSIEFSVEANMSLTMDKLALIDDLAQDVGQMQASVLREVLASDAAEIKALNQSVRDEEKTITRKYLQYELVPEDSRGAGAMQRH